MKKLFEKGLKSVTSIAEKAVDEISNKYELVKEVVNDLPVFVSSEKTKKYGGELYDEKHYFIVPFMLSEVKIALHTMRCLPEDVPEINDLPKRRVFHFPNPHSEVMVRGLLLDQAKEYVEANHSDNSNTLINLANDIDLLDKKLTYGMLLVGGLAAIANPLLGAGIAAKALLPGATGLLSKYGIRPVGEKLSKSQLEKQIQQAKNSVQSDFESSSTIQVINPILQELELALRTTENEHDPIIDFNLASGSIKELDGERWRELTETALYHIYAEVVDRPEKYKEACLGPEDIRWLNLMFRESKANE